MIRCRYNVIGIYLTTYFAYAVDLIGTTVVYLAKIPATLRWHIGTYVVMDAAVGWRILWIVGLHLFLPPGPALAAWADTTDGSLPRLSHEIVSRVLRAKQAKPAPAPQRS